MAQQFNFIQGNSNTIAKQSDQNNIVGSFNSIPERVSFSTILGFGCRIEQPEPDEPVPLKYIKLSGKGCVSQYYGDTAVADGQSQRGTFEVQRAIDTVTGQREMQLGEGDTLYSFAVEPNASTSLDITFNMIEVGGTGRLVQKFYVDLISDATVVSLLDVPTTYYENRPTGVTWTGLTFSTSGTDLKLNIVANGPTGIPITCFMSVVYTIARNN